MINYELFKMGSSFPPVNLINYERFKKPTLADEVDMVRTFRHSPNWRGLRPGAGRPLQKAPSRCISINLPEAVIEILDREANRRRISRSARILPYRAEGIKNAFTEPNMTERSNRKREF